MWARSVGRCLSIVQLPRHHPVLGRSLIHRAGMIICLRDAIIDAHESESCIGHAPHGEAYGGLGFRVPVRALKLKPLLQCEIIIQIGIKQTKLHASIQHLACTISMISAMSGTRPVVTCTGHSTRRTRRELTCAKHSATQSQSWHSIGSIRKRRGSGGRPGLKPRPCWQDRNPPAPNAAREQLELPEGEA